MTKIEGWLSLPWLVMFVWMMIWTPKTKRGWYLAGLIIACQLGLLLYIRCSK